MNLQEFRDQLASDARNENIKLKEELQHIEHEYSTEIQRLAAANIRLINDCAALTNRCWVFTGFSSGTDYMCYHCELGEFKCPHAKSLDEKIAFAMKEMEEAAR